MVNDLKGIAKEFREKPLQSLGCVAWIIAYLGFLFVFLGAISGIVGLAGGAGR